MYSYSRTVMAKNPLTDSRNFHYNTDFNRPPLIAVNTTPCSSVVYSTALCSSVSLSVVTVGVQRLNVGLRKQHQSGNLVFWRQRSQRNSTGVTAYGVAKCRWNGLKSATFDNLAISRKWYNIVAQFLLTSNRKSYTLYRMVTLPMTLSDL